MRVRSSVDRSNRLAPTPNSDLAAPRVAEGGGDAGDEGATTRVQYGIHLARYPLRGMSVAQVRRFLSPILNIDPTAVAVIGTTRIEDEEAHHVTGEEPMLSFVKPSSVKGAA